MIQNSAQITSFFLLPWHLLLSSRSHSHTYFTWSVTSPGPLDLYLLFAMQKCLPFQHWEPHLIIVSRIPLPARSEKVQRLINNRHPRQSKWLLLIVSFSFESRYVSIGLLFHKKDVGIVILLTFTYLAENHVDYPVVYWYQRDRQMTN